MCHDCGLAPKQRRLFRSKNVIALNQYLRRKAHKHSGPRPAAKAMRAADPALRAKSF